MLVLQLFIFGSFTEDETRSLMRTKPSKNAEKAVEKKVLQFGSVEFVPEKSFGGFNGTSSSEQHSSKGVIQCEPLDLLRKDSDAKHGKIARGVGNPPRSLATPTANGQAHDAIATRNSLSNGVTEVQKNNIVGASTFEFENEDGFANEFSNLKLQNGKQNGSVGDFSVPLSKEEPKKASNGQFVAAINLLPRGLINSGNLCFLNATVQALLSCSPFVQLLHELRNGNISKVCL